MPGNEGRLTGPHQSREQEREADAPENAPDKGLMRSGIFPIRAAVFTQYCPAELQNGEALDKGRPTHCGHQEFVIGKRRIR